MQLAGEMQLTSQRLYIELFFLHFKEKYNIVGKIIWKVAQIYILCEMFSNI